MLPNSNPTFIYVLKEPDTGEIRYLGKSDRPSQRFSAHLSRSVKCANHRDCWIFGLIKRGKVPAIEIIDEVPKMEWEFWEREYIRLFRLIKLRLTNVSDGGDCGPARWGCSPSEETKIKMSLAQRGKRFSESHRRKLGEVRKILFAGPGNPFFGKHHTEETKQKIRAAVQKQKRGPTGGFTK